MTFVPPSPNPIQTLLHQLTSRNKNASILSWFIFSIFSWTLKLIWSKYITVSLDMFCDSTRFKINTKNQIILQSPLKILFLLPAIFKKSIVIPYELWLVNGYLGDY